MANFKKRESYAVADGDYGAVVRDAFDLINGDGRIVFSIPSLETATTVYLAGKTFRADKTDLIEQLIRWLSEEQTSKLVKKNGEIDLQPLKGLRADIRIENIENEDYPAPFALVKAIRPFGTLVRENSSQAA